MSSMWNRPVRAIWFSGAALAGIFLAALAGWLAYDAIQRLEGAGLTSADGIQAIARLQGLLGAILAGVVLACLCVAATGLRLRREIDERQAAQDQLKEINDRLAEAIAHRTARLTKTNHELVQQIQKQILTESLLRESEERYRRLVELCPDGICIHKDMRIQFVNGAALQLFGASRAQMIGRDVRDFIHPDYLPRILERIALMKEKGGSVPHMEQKVVRVDGTAVDVEAAAVLMEDRDGVSIQVITRDLTEQKALQARFLRAQRLESIGILAGGIAHDLNNVLTPILMAAKLLRKDRPAEERTRLLDTAEASIQRGSHMVQQLLSFAGGVEGQMATVDVGKVIDEVTSLLQYTLPKSIQIDTQRPADLWPVHGDATQLSQVLMNLCVNAKDAMPDGGSLTIRAGNVNLSAQTSADGPGPGPFVLLTVSDTGTGISAGIIDKIYDPFFTTKEKSKGTGLGLSTALGIIKTHSGTITVATEAGRGTVFNVYLPAQTQPAGPANAALPDNVPAGRGECILVVDDENLIVDAVRATLEANGYRCVSAANGQDALEVFAKGGASIAAALLDMMMPGMDGLELMRRLHALRPDLPVIAASGVRGHGRTAEVMAAGAKAFLQKPYSDEQLLRALAACGLANH